MKIRADVLTILLVVLIVLALFGGFGGGWYHPGYGVGISGLLVIVLVVLLLR